MEQNKNLKKPVGPADYLANERTFLAWIRTSVALMAFGFVIVRFAVFIRQISFMKVSSANIPENRLSAVIGVFMVILGGLMTTFAYIRYRDIEKSLNENKYFPSKWLSVVVTLCLVIGSILLVLYLIPNII